MIKRLNLYYLYGMFYNDISKQHGSNFLVQTGSNFPYCTYTAFKCFQLNARLWFESNEWWCMKHDYTHTCRYEHVNVPHNIQAGITQNIIKYLSVFSFLPSSYQNHEDCVQTHFVVDNSIQTFLVYHII